jgi:release factor glutamine methyltransferase
MVIKSKRASYAKTAGEALKWAAAQLKRKGITQPHLDAEVILVHTLALDRPSLYLQLNHPLSPTELETFKQRIYRRSQHEPVAYILGKKEFWSLDLTVAPEVLIPRPETELLVEETLKIVRGLEEETIKILDIGTGSGNIAISLARELDSCWILALDISLKALLLARNNIQKHQVKEKVQLLAGDMFQPLKHDPASFHLIVSNPPYIPEEDWNDLPPDITEYEPRLALDAGKRGERFLRHIIHKSGKYILPGGYLLLEIGYNQADPVRSWITEEPGLTCLRIIPDYSRIPRIALIKKT